MLSAISFKIYEMRRYLVLSLVISMIAIPVADFFVIERDRNRNEMYGEAFWIYGFDVYDMPDTELAESLPPEWGFNDGLHTLPSYLNVTYEYPVFGLIFFAVATWLFPGAGGLQPLWLNFLLALVFNLNLVLIAILMGDKIYKSDWARFFFAAYFVYGLLMSSGGGKLEPIVDCLFLMSLVLWQENQKGKAMFTLGLAFQTKIYPIVAFPFFFLVSPLSSVWFFASLLLTIIPFAFGARFDSLIDHFLNTSSYSSFVVNPIFPGLVETPYFSPSALIPLIVYSAFVIYTLPLYLPSLDEFRAASWQERIQMLKPLYLYLSPSILFLFRWVMPWYLMWTAPLIFLFDNEEQSKGYLKIITAMGLVYPFGVACNWPYFYPNGPLPDFLQHFPFGWGTLLGIFLVIVMAGIAYKIWKWEFDRRERKAAVYRAAEARGELVV